MTRPEFGTDGVRGTFGENLTVEFVYVLGRAIARVLGTEREFLVGRDTRKSGRQLFAALSSGMKAEGAKVNDLFLISTPGIAMFSRVSGKPACAITASHNPAQDNGIKVFGPGGVKIDAYTEARIESAIDVLINEPIGEIEEYEKPEHRILDLDVYVKYLVDHLKGETLKGLDVVLDCANGAAFEAGPSAFRCAGANVFPINTGSDGVRINYKCGATHLEACVKKVVSTKADIGFAFDGDADRLIVVDNEGNIRDGDFIMALFALEMKEKGLLANNTVVATSMSNGALRSYLEANGVSISEVDVGDKYVLEEMLTKNYALGGEQSGHIIRTDIATWGDGVLNALLLSLIIQKKRRENPSLTTSEILGVFTPMVQLHDKVSVVNKKIATNSNEIATAIAAERETLGEASRIIIRPSGTEDVVRITVEGLSEISVRESLQRLHKVVEEVCR